MGFEPTWQLRYLLIQQTNALSHSAIPPCVYTIDDVLCVYNCVYNMFVAYNHVRIFCITCIKYTNILCVHYVCAQEKRESNPYQWFWRPPFCLLNYSPDVWCVWCICCTYVCLCIAPIAPNAQSVYNIHIYIVCTMQITYVYTIYISACTKIVCVNAHTYYTSVCMCVHVCACVCMCVYIVCTLCLRS